MLIIAFIMMAIFLFSKNYVHGQSFFNSQFSDTEIIELLSEKYRFFRRGSIILPHQANHPDWLTKFYQPTIDSVFSEIIQTDEIIRLDFNRNDELDVIFSHGSHRYSSYLVLDLNTKQSKVYQLTNFSQPIFNFIDFSDNILTYKYTIKGWKSDSIFRGTSYEEAIQKLVFNCGGVVELDNNNKSSNIEIDSIIVSTSYCYGSCPVYKLVIRKDTFSSLNAISYCTDKNGNDLKSGKYFADVNQQRVDSVFDIVNCIGIMNLSDSYSVDWTDDQTITVKTYSSDGRIKTIKDYGRQGTYGLMHLYNSLGKIYRLTDWKEI